VIVPFERTIRLSKSTKIHLLLGFLLLAGSVLQAQHGNSESPENKNSYITLSLWPIADPYAPRLRVGYTQHVAVHWKVGLDVGFGTEEIAIAENNVGADYRLWEIRPEVHYVFNPKAKVLKYISAEIFYIDQTNVFMNGDYQSEEGIDFSFDQADFTRQKYGMHFKFGLFLNLGKRLGFNFYGGVGFRFRNNQYFNLVNTVETDIFREWFATPFEIEGKDFGPNSSLGIKIYYKI